MSYYDDSEPMETRANLLELNGIALSGDAKFANGLQSKLFSLLGSEDKRTFLSFVNGGLAQSKESLSWMENDPNQLLKDPLGRTKAQGFSSIVNTIPSTVGSWNTNGMSMSDAYMKFLNNIEFPRFELTDGSKAAYSKAKNIISETSDSYRKFRTIYNKAFSEYLKDPENEELKQALEDAKTDWEDLGDKNAYETAQAEKNKFERMGPATAVDGQRKKLEEVLKKFSFPYTNVVPANFVTDESAWTKVSFSSSESDQHSSSDSKSWGGGVGVSYGLWSVGGSASSTEETRSMSSNEEKFDIEFEFCRTSIVREWFDSGTLLSREWWWPGATKENPTSGGAIFSDGESPPKEGTWPMLPTEIIWTRNLKITFSSNSQTLKEVKKTLDTKASVGFSFFSISGGYSSSSSSSDATAKVVGNTLIAPGITISGFLCHVFPKLPNPRPEYSSQFSVTPSKSSIVQSTLLLSESEIEDSHETLNGIFDSLKEKASGWIKDNGKKLLEKAKEKAIESAVDWAKKKLADLPQAIITYNNAIEQKDDWKNYHEITKKTCIEQPLKDEEVIRSAVISARVHRRNLSKAKLSNAKDALSIALLTTKMWSPGKVLKVTFLDGKKEIQEKVEKFAKTWEKYCSIVFDFGNYHDAEIRISFLGQGSWSYVGTDCLLPSLIGKPTMNFGWFDENTADTEYSRTVIHEFGHALGCIHEHQNPKGGIKWNESLAMNYYKETQSWDEETVKNNIFKKYDVNTLRASEYDRDSIMHYPIPQELMIDTPGIGYNNKLSKEDKNWIGKVYPPVESGAARGFENITGFEKEFTTLNAFSDTIGVLKIFPTNTPEKSPVTPSKKPSVTPSKKPLIDEEYYPVPF